MLQHVFLCGVVLMVLCASAGSFLNYHVVELNGGLMPVATNSENNLGLARFLIDQELVQGMHVHVLATPEDRWVWAADRFRLPKKKTFVFGNDYSCDIVGFFSAGDFLFLLGRRLDSIFALCFCGVIAIRGAWKIFALSKSVLSTP
jgi:hypothetical protein